MFSAPSSLRNLLKLNMQLVAVICILQTTTNLLVGRYTLLLLCRGRLKKYTKIYKASTQPLDCSLNSDLLPGGVNQSLPFLVWPWKIDLSSRLNRCKLKVCCRAVNY